jgi:hypothetical protein
MVAFQFALMQFVEPKEPTFPEEKSRQQAHPHLEWGVHTGANMLSL